MKAAGKKAAAARVLPEATISEARGVRYLHLGTPWIQGAMRLDDPLAIELEYVRRMMVWLLARSEARQGGLRAVQLGLGAAAITRYCVKRLKMKTIAVELNPHVVAACRHWFRLPEESPLLTVLTMDAAAFVADSKRRASADVLCVDLYDEDAASPVLDDRDFYLGCHDLLDVGGCMTVNLFGRDARADSSVARLAEVFGAAHLRQLKPTSEGNTIVLAMKQVTLPDRAELARRAENIETRLGLPARKWLRMMQSPPIVLPAVLPELSSP
ncbi:MAG: spermidine synthase [Pseudomonadota bacterium]|nr:spermidine synthase [Pseudomonadota bacterium]